MFWSSSRVRVPGGAVNAPHSMRRESRHVHSDFQLFHPASGRTWPLKIGINKIGRSLDNDIVLVDDAVSRHHAIIHVDGQTVYIEDTRSINGVYVAGERVKSAVLMRDVLFSLGRVDLVVRKPTVLEGGSGNWMTSRD